jgi:hypothetical protein
MTNRAFLVIAVVLVGSMACASASSAPPGPTQRVLATDDQGTIRVQEGAASDSVVDAPPAAVFAALQAAYQDLGIEIKLLDPARRVVGNKRFSKMFELDGVRLSKYVGCGTTQTGPTADAYRVTMSLVSSVTPSGSGSRLETQLIAYAEDISSSKGRISCITLGALEQRVHALAVSHLAG